MFQENDQMFLFENSNFFFDNGSQKLEFCLNPTSNQEENFMFFDELTKHCNIPPQKEFTIKQEINLPITSKEKIEEIQKSQMKCSKEKLKPDNSMSSRNPLNKEINQNFKNHSIEDQNQNTKNYKKNLENFANQNITSKFSESSILNEICKNENKNSKTLIEKKDVLEIHHSNQKKADVEIQHSKILNITNNEFAIMKETSKKENFFISIIPSNKKNFENMNSSFILNKKSIILKENNFDKKNEVIGGTLSKILNKAENDIPKKKDTFKNEDFSSSQILMNNNYDNFSRHSIINKNFSTSILKENNEKKEVTKEKQSKIQSNNDHKTLIFRPKDKDMAPNEKKVIFDTNEALDFKDLTKKNEFCLNNEPKKIVANFRFGFIQKLEKIVEEEEPKNFKNVKQQAEINQKMNLEKNDVKTIYPNKNLNKKLENEAKKTFENLALDSKKHIVIECSKENRILDQTNDSNKNNENTDPTITKKEKRKNIYPFKIFNNNEFTNDNQNQEKKEKNKEKNPKAFSFEPKKILNNSLGNLKESLQNQKILENNEKKLLIKIINNENASTLQHLIENPNNKKDDDVLENKYKTEQKNINLEFNEEFLQNLERKNSIDDHLLRNEQNNENRSEPNKEIEQISSMLITPQKDQIKPLFTQQSKIIKMKNNLTFEIL